MKYRNVKFIAASVVSDPPLLSDSKGSAKLEKAEILQMTVDHLKMLHAAGGKGASAENTHC